MKTRRPIAVVCADIHLSVTPPVWRSAESDWFAAMRRPLDQLKATAKKYNVPIICAGDVFDKWNPPPELINFAIRHLPEMYAVPGQHDLPYHIDEDMERSAFGTMVNIGRIKLLGMKATEIDGAYVFGFGWGRPIFPTQERSHPNQPIHVAVVHAYCWHNAASYPGAKESHNAGNFAKQLGGFDVGIFGDNHKGFRYCPERPLQPKTILNCGGFMRRKSDEVNRKPSIGILYSDATIERMRLDISEDKTINKAEVIAAENVDAEIAEFVQNLRSMNADTFDFPASIKRYIETEKPSPGVRKILLETITT